MNAPAPGPTPPPWRARTWLAAALALTAFKLWLTRGQGVFAIANAGLDDRLFVDLAYHLIHGNWLGPYNELTLAKGPFYPLFIAAVFWLGLPLFLAQHLFYAGACAAFTRALRPAVPSAGWQCAIYSLLLWNPMTFDAPAMGRVLRQHVYGPLALMIFAGLIALALRRNEPGRRSRLWIWLLGLSGGAFYLTREETFWLVPGVLLLATAATVLAWRTAADLGRRLLTRLGTALVIAALPVLLVCIENKRNYGWFGTCELRSSEFEAAYGAMLRVRVGPTLPYVPVTREAREAMARVSPKFALVQAQFDAGVAQGWAGASEFLTHLPPAQQQVGGGWLMWALREATARAGFHHDANQAISFYKHLARELNAACDDGRLPAGPPRRGFLPPWRDEWSGAFWHKAWEFADFVLRFSRFSARPPPSEGSPADLDLFRDVTGERLSPPAGELDVVGAAEYLHNVAKVDRLHAIGKNLRPLLMTLVALALAAFALRVVWCVARRTWSYPLTVAAALAGCVAASVLMHALIEVTSFPVLTISSFAPVYPLVLAFVVAAGWDLADVWRHRRAPRATPADAPVSAAPDLPASRWLPWLCAAAALAPFVVGFAAFRQLYWFADDLFLVDQMAENGFGPWIPQMFTESFVPLFKLLWGGTILVSGNYTVLLGLMWLTHALNTVLFQRWLARGGLGTFASIAAALVFAVTPANLETLGWSVQWSAILATTFLLAGLWWSDVRPGAPGFDWRRDVPLALCAAASACSFARGVLTGPLLAAGLLLALGGRNAWPRLASALLCLVPAVGVALVINGRGAGNHQHLAGHAGEILEFASSYFLLNPGHALTGYASDAVRLLGLAAAKLLVLAAAFWLARGPARRVLVLALLFDLGNALLLGIGRYHTGFDASLSSRYQYGALIATLPAAAFLLQRALAFAVRGRARADWTFATAAALLAVLAFRGWSAELKEFTGWRGTDMRQLLAAPATDDPNAKLPALDFMHVERAKALVRAYNLH